MGRVTGKSDLLEKKVKNAANLPSNGCLFSNENHANHQTMVWAQFEQLQSFRYRKCRMQWRGRAQALQQIQESNTFFRELPGGNCWRHITMATFLNRQLFFSSYFVAKEGTPVPAIFFSFLPWGNAHSGSCWPATSSHGVCIHQPLQNLLWAWGCPASALWELACCRYPGGELPKPLPLSYKAVRERALLGISSEAGNSMTRTRDNGREHRFIGRRFLEGPGCISWLSSFFYDTLFSPFLNNCGWNTIIGSNATNG